MGAEAMEMYESGEREQLLTDIAKMYYIENLSQQSIADRLHMSRSNVSLLLKSCVENHIIEIRVNDSLTRAHDLAERLRKAHGIRSVLIARSGADAAKSLESVARLTAHMLEERLKTGMLLGYDPHPAVRMAAEALSFSDYLRADAVQLTGGLSAAYSGFDGQPLGGVLRKKLNGTAWVLQAPLMVKSTALRRELLEESVIKETFSRYPRMDLALAYAEKPDLMREDDLMLNPVDASQLSELGAVCRFCGRYFDKDGQLCSGGINERVIAVPLETLEQVPLTVFSAGAQNAPAVRSLLMRRHIDTLILDEALAKSL